MGRGDKDITSPFMRLLQVPGRCILLWGNESGYCSLLQVHHLQSITFMAADSFHARVEKELRIMKNIHDFLDFVACIRAAGITIELVTGDFWEWSNGLSQGKASKDSKPLLEEVCMVEFRVGEAKMYFKR